MRAATKICALFAAGIAFVMISAAMPVAAVDRGGGDFWTYATTADFLGIEITGTITYTYEESRSLTVGSEVYRVNVLSVDGSESGSGTIIVPFSISITHGGFLYVTRDGMGIVKDDAVTWTNTTWGSPGFQLTTNSEEELVTTFSPPMMTGFDTEASEAGDSWIETTTMTEETWVNGTLDDESSDEVTFGIAIWSQTESLETDTGTFETLKITATDDDGYRTVFWWSSEVGNFVQQHTYESGSDDPSTTMLLTDYSYSPGLDSVLLFVAIGGAVLIVALVVLALVMLRRRPSQPFPYQPGTPAPPPSPRQPGQP